MTSFPVIPGFQDLTQADTEHMDIIEKGKGVYVWDRNGKEYLDTSASFFCMTLGYSNPEIGQAIAQQAEKLSFHVSGEGKLPGITLQAATEIARLAPFDDAHVLFSSTGTEANEFCQKLLRLAAWGRGEKQRTKVITRQGSYHGGSLAATSMTQLYPTAGNEFMLPMPGFLAVTQPDYRNCAQPGESEAAFVDRLINEIDALIQREGPKTIVAFVAEPVSFSSALAVPPCDYFPRLQALLKGYGIALVADEVINAFGRLGKLFASPELGAQPDAIVVAKGMTSGHFPMSAVIVSGEMYQQVLEASSKLPGLAHASTYAGHPLGAAAVLAVLDILQRPGFLEEVQQRGSYLAEQLRPFADSDLIVDFRHWQGMAVALQFAGDPEQAAERARNVAAACDEEGLIVRAVGHSLVFAPPLVITEAEIDELARRFSAGWSRVAASLNC